MRPNIIFYFSDQQRWDTVNETVTPNLMKLAENGVNFTNSYTCQPGLRTGSCLPSNRSLCDAKPMLLEWNSASAKH